jgi:hypothetical protein
VIPDAATVSALYSAVGRDLAVAAARGEPAVAAIKDHFRLIRLADALRTTRRVSTRWPSSRSCARSSHR